MTTTKRRQPRNTQVASSRPESKLKSLFKKFFSAKHIKDFKHLMSSFVYLLGVVLVGLFIQFVWNYSLDLLNIENYHMTWFEAAILWVCIY